MVDDQVDLLGQLLVDRCDDRLDRDQRVVRYKVGLRQRLLRQRPHRCSTESRMRSLFGLNSRLRSAAKSLVVVAGCAKFDCVSSVAAIGYSSLPAASGACAGDGCAASVCSRAGSFSTDLDQLLGAALAVHVGHQVGQLRARLEQLGEAVDLARDRRRREVVHALEGDVDGEVAFAGQRVRHLERDARLHRLHAAVEVVDVDLEELAVGDRRQRLGRLAGQVGHHAHHERQLNLLLRAVDLDVVFDLHARRAVAGDEFLTARFRHVLRPSPDRGNRYGSAPFR